MSDNPFADGDIPIVTDANPYASPQITTMASDPGRGEPALDGAAEMLRQTKPWVRFISVMLFLGAAFIALAGLFVMGGGISEAMPGGIGAFLGFIYIAMAFLYIVPAVFLWMYADRIGVFLRDRSPGRLASALAAQKSFWRFVGIAMLVILCLYGLMFVLGIVFAVGSSF